MIHSIHEKYDVRDRMYNQSSELMFYRLYYDDQSVGTDSWGEPVAQSFNHNGTINGTRTVYNWDHTTMPSNAGMEGALLYGYQYDRLNRLLRADAIVEDYVTTQSGSNLYNCYGIGDVNVKYDPVGNIKQILRTLPETYAMGTLQLQHLNFAVGNTHNRVSQVTDPLAGLREFTYDVNGNLISDSKNGILQTDIGRSSYPYQLKGIHPATSESIQYTYLYDTDDSRIFKRVEEGSALQMEYYLKDIGIYDMISDKWTYFVQGDDRIAKVFPQNYQSPGQNAANTDLKVSQGMANFYEYDHLGNTRIVYSVRDIHNGTTSFDIHFAADYYPYGKTLRYFESAAFEEKFLTTQHERDRETGFDYRGARYYDSDLGRFLSLDPLAAKFPAWSPYNYVMGNPLSFTDPDGKEPESIIINKVTGEATYIDDGINKVFVTSQDGYDIVDSYKEYAEGDLSVGGNKFIAETYLGYIQSEGYELSMDSDIGLTARTTYAEMSGIGNTSDVDRQVVAESIVNRANSGKYGKTYSDILKPSQYNAVGKPSYNDPFGYIDGLKTGSGTKSFFKAKADAITGNLSNSFSVAYKAINGIGSPISNGAEFYVSPPLKSTHFDGNNQLINITSTINGLKGISGVWKRK